MSTPFLTIYNYNPDLQNLTINTDTLKHLQAICAMFETKNRHSEALNSPLLGVVPIFFTSTDRAALFTIFNITEESINKTIDELPGIDPSWNVARDAYNHLILWAAYKTINSKLSNQQINDILFLLFKLLHYKFFTSIVYNSYKHGADPNVMEAVINGLSNKFDIIQEGTWKKVLEARSRDVFSSTSIHLQTIQQFKENDDVLYLLSDIQTRLRQKIKLITILYYQKKEDGEEISSYNLIDTVDGEKVIAAQTSVFDSMIEGLVNQIQSSSRFVDMELIKVLCTKFQYISEEMLRSTLVMLSDTAALQAQSHDLNKSKKNKQGEELYIGLGLLVREIIQKTYRTCILDKVNISSKSSILLKTNNLYTNSRINDDYILNIKRSMLHFVIECKKSTRDATNASLSIAIILYIIIKSFEYLP